MPNYFAHGMWPTWPYSWNINWSDACHICLTCLKEQSSLWTSLSSLCLGWNTFLITQIRTGKEGKDYRLQCLSCLDRSVLQSWVLWQWMHVSIPGLCSSFLTSLTSTPSRLRSPAICNSFLFLKHARWPQSFCIHFSLELSSLQVCT